MSDTPGAGTLSEQIAAVEQRAREAVMDCARHYEPAMMWTHTDILDALTRYAAVCKLAGRWEQHSGEGNSIDHDYRAELAALVAEMEP